MHLADPVTPGENEEAGGGGSWGRLCVVGGRGCYISLDNSRIRMSATASYLSGCMADNVTLMYSWSENLV